MSSMLPQRPLARLAILSLALLTAAAISGCGKKKVVLPPPSADRTAETAAPPDRPAAAADAPELDVSVAPSLIQPGESAWLAWESRNAARVSIEPRIGRVDQRGQIQVYPNQSTTYRVTAEGPGGSVERSAMVEVVSSESSPGLSSSDIGMADLPLEERFKLAVKPVFFEFDSAELTPEAKTILEANADWLMRSENAEARFIIEGHCDLRGTDEYNLALGDKRAQVVRLFLTSKGLDAGRMLTISYGEERPFETGDTEEAHALNRRAHFVVRK